MANKALKLNSGRQYPLVAEVAFGFENVTDTGVAVPAVKLPIGAQVIGGSVVIDTAFNFVLGTGGSAVLDVGDSAVDTRYANDVNLVAAGRTALVPTGFVANGEDIAIKPVLTTITTAATAGKGRLVVEYVMANRANEVQTN